MKRSDKRSEIKRLDDKSRRGMYLYEDYKHGRKPLSREFLRVPYGLAVKK